MHEFSMAARAELARVRPDNQCCARAELGGILRAGGSLHLLGQGRVTVSVETEHADVARKVMILLRRVAGLPAKFAVEDHEQLRRRRIYRVEIAPGPETRRLLGELGILSPGGEIEGDIPAFLMHGECCRAAFLRGAYLMSGSVCDPRGSSYHLEIVAANVELGQGLCYLMNLLHLKAHISARKGKHVVYLKDIDDIGSFLRLTRAHAALLDLEEVRVVKEVRGGVNRLVNAETANVDKSVSAAQDQILLIEAIEAEIGLDRLPIALRQIARARLANPEATLTELGLMLPQPASKSAVNHRLRRLRHYAEAVLGPEKENSPP